MSGDNPQNTLAGATDQKSPSPPTVELNFTATPVASEAVARSPSSTSRSREADELLIAAANNVRQGFGTLPQSALRSLPSMEFPDYEVLCELGRGGMGVVYKARNVRLPDKLVAIKMLSRSSTASLDEMIRFRAEAEMVASLQHENIIDIYDIKTDGGLTYLILEYIDGGSLADWLKTHRPSPRETAQLVETLARAVQFAHDKKIIHRDLKPANVLRTKTGVLKVTDFGLGKSLDHVDDVSRTHAGVIMGTPPYMAPEQAAGRSKEVSPATDVYALGAILYEMLTGRPLFIGENLTSLLHQMQHDEPIPPSWLAPLRHREKQLSTICLKCLEKNPSKRYQSAGELADELHLWLDEQPIRTKPIGRFGRAWRYVRRRPWPFALAASTVAIGLLLVVWALNDRENRRIATNYQKQTELAERERDQREQTKEQYRKSLGTLSSILTEASDGTMSKMTGLGKLHDILREHYNSLLDDQSLAYLDPHQLADDLCRLGQLIYKRGDKTEALEVFERAKSLYQRGDDAKSPEMMRKQATTCAEIGNVLSKLPGRRGDAEVALHHAEAILLGLTQRSDIDQGRVQRDLAEVYHLLGELHIDWRQNQGDIESAELYFRKGLDLRKQLRPPAGDEQLALQDARDLARSYGYLGDALLYLGKLDLADEAYWASHRLREKLFKELKEQIERSSSEYSPHKSADKDRVALEEAKFQLARSWGNFGNFQYRIKSYATAVHFFEQSIILRKELVQENPANVEYLADLCGCYNRMAELKLLSEATKGDALELTALAIVGEKKLIEMDPKALNTKRTYAESLVLAGEANIDRSPAQASSDLDKAKQVLTPLIEIRPSPDDMFNYCAVRAMRTEFAGKGLNTELVHQARLDIAKQLKVGEKDFRPGMTYREIVTRFRAFKCLRDLPEPDVANKK